MSYTVTWRAIPGKQLISTEFYDELYAANASADVQTVRGGPVEIIVTDEQGSVLSRRIVGNA